MITMATNKEYSDWKNDPVAQQEYKHYLLKELKEIEPNYLNQFTNQFNQIFKETK